MKSENFYFHSSLCKSVRDLNILSILYFYIYIFKYAKMYIFILNNYNVISSYLRDELFNESLFFLYINFVIKFYQ